VLWPRAPGDGLPLMWAQPHMALSIPSVARAVSIYKGQIKQAPMDDYAGVVPQARPRLLDQPDPNEPRSWFIECQVEDYLTNGNAVHYITAFTPTGWPAAATWIPATWVSIACQPRDYSNRTYLVGGVELDPRRVVHVRRGADRWCPARGVSVIEQHLATLDRVAMQEEYERQNLREGSVPSAAVITPNARLGDTESEAAKVDWLEKFIGPGRRPAILPAGTQVIPLGWSPADSQMDEARKMSLTDVANAFNLDGYWLGAPTTSLTYRSPGPMYTHLLRLSLGPVLVDFEDVWSGAWLPRGHRVVFDRVTLQRDDLASTVDTMTKATSGDRPLMSVPEARVYMNLPPSPTDLVTTSPVDTQSTEGQPA
jgi:phage portal protein BeeE